MNYKDLAEEYADLQRQVQQDAPEEVVDLSKGIFGYDDIKAAFNAGRESVVENMPEFEWKYLSYKEEYHSSCLLGWSYIITQRAIEIALFCNYHFLNYYLSVEEAKQAANEHYKKQIKQALRL